MQLTGLYKSRRGRVFKNQLSMILKNQGLEQRRYLIVGTLLLSLPPHLSMANLVS